LCTRGSETRAPYGDERAAFPIVKILIAVDRSEASREVVDQICRRPWPEAASFEVVHAVGATHPWVTAETAVALTRNARGVLEAAVSGLAQRGIAATGQLLEGDP
jgi:hypothetical protein